MLGVQMVEEHLAKERTESRRLAFELKEAEVFSQNSRWILDF